MLAQAEALGREWRVAQYAERVAVVRARLWLTAPRGPGGTTATAGTPEDAWHAGETPGYVGLLERLTLARLCIMQGRCSCHRKCPTRLSQMGHDAPLSAA